MDFLVSKLTENTTKIKAYEEIESLSETFLTHNIPANDMLTITYDFVSSEHRLYIKNFDNQTKTVFIPNSTIELGVVFGLKCLVFSVFLHMLDKSTPFSELEVIKDALIVFIPIFFSYIFLSSITHKRKGTKHYVAYQNIDNVQIVKDFNIFTHDIHEVGLTELSSKLLETYRKAKQILWVESKLLKEQENLDNLRKIAELAKDPTSIETYINKLEEIKEILILINCSFAKLKEQQKKLFPLLKADFTETNISVDELTKSAVELMLNMNDIADSTNHLQTKTQPYLS